MVNREETGMKIAAADHKIAARTKEDLMFNIIVYGFSALVLLVTI